MATLPTAGLDTGTPAVILKFDQNVMHHGGLGAIRSLGRLGVPVYGVHEGPWAPAASSRYLRGRWIWQPDAEDVERTLAGLLTLAERIGHRAVLIPTDDAGAIFLAEHGGPLRQAFLFPAPPAGLPRQVAGKFSMHELCREAGVPCPSVMMPASLTEAGDFAARHGYPVVAKLSVPWSTSNAGLRSTSVIDSAGDLARLWHACEAASAGLMLQEFIPAASPGDWFFHGYCDVNSECQPAFTGIKLRSYPAHAGLTSLGCAVANDELRTQLTALLAELSYTGLVDLDLRRDARDGQYKLLDFNPRLGAQFRLFRNADGVDVVVAAYLDLTGQAVPEGTQLDGRRFLAENYDPIAAFRYWRDGELRAVSWLASLRTVNELAWFATDDLRPFGLMCARMAARGITRRFRRPAPSPAPGGPPRYRAGRAHGRLANPAARAARPELLPAAGNSPHARGTAGAVPATRGESV